MTSFLLFLCLSGCWAQFASRLEYMSQNGCTGLVMGIADTDVTNPCSATCFNFNSTRPGSIRITCPAPPSVAQPLPAPSYTVYAHATPTCSAAVRGVQSYRQGVCIATGATTSLFMDLCVTNATATSVTYRNYGTIDCTLPPTAAKSSSWINGLCSPFSGTGIPGVNFAIQTCTGTLLAPLVFFALLSLTL
jgi:hypothetical protein